MTIKINCHSHFYTFKVGPSNQVRVRIFCLGPFFRKLNSWCGFFSEYFDYRNHFLLSSIEYISSGQLPILSEDNYDFYHVTKTTLKFKLVTKLSFCQKLDEKKFNFHKIASVIGKKYLLSYTYLQMYLRFFNDLRRY